MNDQQLLRFSRHLLLPQLDIAGQEKLIASTVLVLGVGGLGSPVTLYLAASGIGRLILVDHDQVELSNLQRQIAHGTMDIGQPKVESAAASAQGLNPDVQVELVNQAANADNLPGLIQKATVVVDATDNLATRQLVNQLCYQLEVPLVSGSAIGIEGQLMVVDGSRDTSCYQCLYQEGQEQSLNCAESGVLAPLVGVIGSLQAVETIKVILAQHQPGKLHLYDAWAGQFRQLALPKRPGCPVCGARARLES